MKRSEILALIAKVEADAAAKRDGFGIGELGKVSEADAAEQALRQTQHDAAQERAARSRCHYCGMPATSTDFFGAPVCEDCEH